MIKKNWLCVTVWILATLAVILGLKITHNINCLWALIFPALSCYKGNFITIKIIYKSDKVNNNEDVKEEIEPYTK